MAKIDFYAQQLAKHNATAIELVSGQPVRYKLPDGDRDTAKAIEHPALATIVQEAAPPSAIDSLRATRRAEFTHRAEDGTDVLVQVDTTAGDVWTVRILPAPASSGRRPDAAAAQPAARPAPIAPAMPQPAAQRPAPIAPAMPQPAAQRPATSIGGHGAANIQMPAGDASPMPMRAAARAASDVSIPLGNGPAPRPGAAPGAPRVEPAPMPAASGGGDHGKKIAGEGVRIELGASEPKLNYYLRMMKAVDASDLHLSSGVVPMARRHGEMVQLIDRGPMTDEEMRVMVDEVIPERSRVELEATNDADFAHEIVGLCRFRANVFRDRRGTGGVFRQIPFEIVSAEKLGIPKRVLDLCYLTKGLVLVTGPTGSGKSTTLATMIDYVNTHRSDHIITIEDPVEFVHPNKNCLVNQREIGTHTKSFKAALRAALREDPDIVLVGEMRDLETIAIAIETAETGHLVFGTLHTTSAPSTVDRIIDQFPPEQQAQIRVMLSESLRGVISQVLLKKKGGGRIAGYEVLIANSAVANLIREAKTFQLKSVMQTGRRLGMQTMNDHILEHVANGLVEPMEAYMKSNDKVVMKEALAREGHKLDLGGD
jgi:twitching motility protein PilT